ncbi:MAG: DUF4919 domain-containing protein [Muribaculaceae bacterium]|jgi:hypothetical protein|nr:DUF4919 domain-containing protein [Muribaculaceae bacterium]
MKQNIFTLRTLLVTLTIALTLTAAAQRPQPPASGKFEVHKVDFNHVKEVIENPNSVYFYPKLMQSFLSNDTTMSIEAYRNLYYGYTFQEDYNPFRMSVYSNVVEQLYYKQPHSREECDSIMKYAGLSLDDNIFDLDQMQYFIFALKEKKRHARAAVRQFRHDRIVAAIMSSGKGTKEEPWVVIMPSHEYNIVNMLGYVATEHRDEGNGLEYIAVQPKEGKTTQGFYFDVKRMMEVANLKFPDK